ncbi:hypothetical protein CkaCkLH20_02033 [Colletotrichum karsti]|uniref:Uncharacterized protein n=1 Tax=Colletotrichum karsti TaxID=1095194 RepID=A0A9P6LL53_9PEZI|nr:uncharacterized protein CkaCkLH20_02033 [Colletotrichum karsti]KAF9880079.1 hypothetical protein CkaCkLH20_02033 [Colletotrichum karsti]
MFATKDLDKDETIYETNNQVWPKTYRLRLVSRHWIPGWPYTAAVVIHLQGLPQQVQDGAGIDWDDLQQHFEFTRSWCTDQESWKSTTEWKRFRLGVPKWELRVHLQHYSLKQVHHPDCRGLIDLKKMNFLSIYERIGLDHHKEVVRFDQNVMYGNDLSGQEVQAWNTEDMPEELQAFLKSLYPTP